jgi:hypothetical protein
MSNRLNSVQTGSGGGGAGTVTSVALTVPGIFTVAGSPVTTSGVLAVTLQTQNANLIWAGPVSGGATYPIFRNIVNADYATNSAFTGTLTATGQFAAGNATVDASAFARIGWQGGSGILSGNNEQGLVVDAEAAFGCTTSFYQISSQIYTSAGVYTISNAVAYNANLAQLGASCVVGRLANYYGAMPVSGSNNSWGADNNSYSGNFVFNFTSTNPSSFGGPLKTTDSTQSTTTATGSVVASGGLGVAKNAYIGGNINAGAFIQSGNYHVEPSYYSAGNSGASIQLDFSQANVIGVTLSGGSTVGLFFTNGQSGAPYLLRLIQGTSLATTLGPTGTIIDFGANGSPVLSVGLGKVDYLNLWTPDGVSTWHCLGYQLGY